MNLGAGLGMYLDARLRVHVVTRLKTPEAGFSISPDDPDCWIWRLQLNELQNELDAPSGSAVVLSEILGVPFARLRAALPDELMTSPLASALGRKQAFSVSGMISARQSIRLKRESRSTDIAKLADETRSTGVLKLAEAEAGSGTKEADTEVAEEIETAATTTVASHSAEGVRLEQMVRGYPHPCTGWGSSAGRALGACAGCLVCRADTLALQVGTALVLASLQAATLMPVVELAQHVSAAKRHFAAMLTPAGKPFDQLCTDLITMMSPGNIDLRRKWLPRVRMWKLLLSQNTDGSWPASSTTAFALEARATSETEVLKQTLLERIKERLSNVAEEMDADHGSATEAVLQGLRSEQELDPATPRSPGAPEAYSGDDPLTCSVDAIVASIPSRLAAVKAVDASVDVVRVWTTMCCVASLQRLNVSWVWGDGDIYEERERTVVDAGREWVEQYAEEKPALKEALTGGSVRAAAERTTGLWRRACEMRVAELRRSEPMTSQLMVSHVHRAGTEITRALVTGHSTFSTFLSEPLGGLQRWQSACALCERRVCGASYSPAHAPSVRYPGHSHHRAASGQHLDVSARLCALIALLAFTYATRHLAGSTRKRVRPLKLTASTALCSAQRGLAHFVLASRSVNCCEAVRLLLDSGPDGGYCSTVGNCRGFNGTCGELAGQFATVAVLPDYPNGLQDYTCHEFPDDDNSVDSFIVALIALAIGACWSIANCLPVADTR